VLITQLVETTVGVGTGYGDANLDGVVDRLDVTVVLANLAFVGSPAWSRGDFTGDGRVDLADVARQQQNLDPAVAPSAAADSAIGAAPISRPRSEMRLGAMRLRSTRLAPPKVDIALTDVDVLPSQSPLALRASRRIR
jgi:hypothetical protein